MWMPAWCANRYVKVVEAYGVLYESIGEHKKLERILTRQVSTATAAMAGAQKSADIANENLEKALGALAEPVPLYKEPMIVYLGGIATVLAVVGAVTAIIVSGSSTAP